MKLSELSIGVCARIERIDTECDYEVHQRFLDLGFVKGAEIEVHNISPLGDPIAYSIYNTIISLRKSDAASVFISVVEQE